MLRIGITVKNKRKKDEGEEEVSVMDRPRSNCKEKKKSVTGIEKSQTERNRQSMKRVTTQVLENEAEGVGEKEKEAYHLLQ